MIPFNDLSRIHLPLQHLFSDKFREIVSTSQFVLGEEVFEFENALAKIEGSKFSVAVNNGTNSLELALRAAGVGAGDEVITTAFTFVATAHAIQQTGARCVLVDISPNLPIIDFTKIEEKISEKTKAIVIVSLHGIVDNLDEFQLIARKYGVRLILDGAQSHLAKYNGRFLSSYFDAISLSFYPGKNLGALGEGGAVLTDNEGVAERVRLYRDWGAREKYNHEYWGGNYRLEPLQAAMLRIKLPHLKNWTDQRKKLGQSYIDAIPNEYLALNLSIKGDHVFHMLTLQSDVRDEIQNKFNSEEIGWGIHYPRAIHQNPYYSKLKSSNESFPNAEKFASSTISLPIFPEMQVWEQQKVIEVLLDVLS
jgi:dTDP-4-amino-4,6-dideoxygalactose transaminase